MIDGRRRAARLAVPLALLLAAGVPAVGLSGAAGAQDRAAEELRFGPADLTVPSGVRVLARVPAALTGRPLPASAFAARQAGRPVAVTADQLADGDAQLVLAVDTSTSPEALAAQQSAAADLLRTLPPDLPTVVLPGGTPTTARAAVRQVGALAPGTAGLLDGLPAPVPGRRWLVAYADCPALDRLPAAPDARDLRVHLLVSGSGCADRARALVAPTGGTARTGLGEPGQLVAATDATSAELLGEYRLQIAADRGAGPIAVSVTSSGLVAQASVPLPVPIGSGGPPPPGAGAAGPAPSPTATVLARPPADAADLPRGPVVLAIVLVALGAAGLLLLLATAPEPEEAD